MQTMKRQENISHMHDPNIELKDREVYYLKFFGWDTKRMMIPMLTKEDLEDAIVVFDELLGELKAIKRAELRISMKTAIAQQVIQDASQELRYRKKKREQS